MILKFNQVQRQPAPAYHVFLKDKVVADGVGSTRNYNSRITIAENNYELSEVHDSKTGEGKKLTQVTDIIKNGEVIGVIYPDLVEQKKIWFISLGYSYFAIEFYGKKYFGYEVGLGPEQHYVCIYDEKGTVAIIHKLDKVVNYRDNYIIYFEDENLFDMLCIFNLYFDCVVCPDIGETTGGYSEDSSYYSTNKELNSKYDSTFIEKIIKLENDDSNI